MPNVQVVVAGQYTAHWFAHKADWLCVGRESHVQTIYKCTRYLSPRAQGQAHSPTSRVVVAGRPIKPDCSHWPASAPLLSDTHPFLIHREGRLILAVPPDPDEGGPASYY